MLTEVKAYSAWQSAPTLYLSEGGRAETDSIQIRNIDGLDPVPASVGTTPYGYADGEAYVGSSVLSRNIVLALHPNPDWSIWTPEALRGLLYSYFMPKQAVRLAFLSDDKPDVDISGIVESISANAFSKDPEYIASIICPDPYFRAVTPIILTGKTSDNEIDIDYGGNIPGGIQVEVDRVSDPAPGNISIQIGNPDISFFQIISPSMVTASKYFHMSSFPMSKYVETVNKTNGTIQSLLSNVNTKTGSEWPVLQPGTNTFQVTSDGGVQSWELTYFERFGGL